MSPVEPHPGDPASRARDPGTNQNSKEGFLQSPGQCVTRLFGPINDCGLVVRGLLALVAIEFLLEIFFGLCWSMG